MSFEIERKAQEQINETKEERVTRYFSDKNLPAPVPAIKAAPLTGHTNSVSRVIAFDSGSLIATACYDGKVRVYDSSGGTSILRHELVGQSGLVLGLAPLCGSVIVSGGWDDKIITWDARSGERLDTYKLEDASINTIASIDSSTFVAGTGGGDIIFFSHVKGKKIKEVSRISSAHDAWINHIVIRGDYMVTASFDKTAALWSCSSKEKLAVLKHPSNVWCASISSRFVATGAQGEVRVYEIQKECELKLVLKGVHAEEFVHAVALAGDEWLLSAGGDGTVTFTSLSSEKPAVRVSTSVPYVLDITLLPNGRVAVCGNETNDSYSSVFSSPGKLKEPLSQYTDTLFPKKESITVSKPLTMNKCDEKEVIENNVPETKDAIEDPSINKKSLIDDNVDRDEVKNKPIDRISEETENHDSNFVSSMIKQWSKFDEKTENNNAKSSTSSTKELVHEPELKENKVKEVQNEQDKAPSPNTKSVKSLIEQWSNR